MKFDAGSFILGGILGGIAMAIWGGSRVLETFVKAEQQGYISVNEKKLKSLQRASFAAYDPPISLR